MEFHISRRARDKYQFDESLFSITGNVVFANFLAARQFAKKINDRRDLVNFPEQAVRAGQINALGLIDEIMHYVVGLYRTQVDPEIIREALAELYAQLGRDAVDGVLRRFLDEFPPVAVYKRETDADSYLDGNTEGVPNRQIVLEEMLMVWLANVNPASVPLRELFDDVNLQKETSYLRVISELGKFFAEKPPFGPSHQSLVEMLGTPAKRVPHSLPGQLDYILTNWGFLVGKYLYRLLGSLDLIKEEERMFVLGGAGPAEVPVYRTARAGGEGEPELEQFTPDRDWMPNVVMIAKTSYVWLDQLSRKYGRAITRLDQIPDEELDQLARWGITGLWFIGIWERSPASQKIKQLMGNRDAVASAYSIFEYSIASDLGGDEAYNNLRERAWRKGIRLASDMVPNHMGIDSKWVMEHPDWFVELEDSPFPSYSFNGPDLSGDPRVGIFIEDHYYDKSDAAVVFKRTDHWSGDTKYVYHGNDGTSYPWNDTAQLNYLKHEVREAVIQTILHVARRFPIIRFDAAMTLTKKHYQRLWFPEPGTGGAIPSRAEHGLTKEQFDAAMPVEFWREVVDRIAVEAPDTLLLAEAFWLLEGYFVRTLGMHRVYNSAFMHMLRDEENSKYRSVIKNTIEFDPEILKRYVNFMNNPDERTAVDQFGKDDKYFGVCTMLVTMPGLPMFGHGQVEGFSERYGMDFRRALWNEQPDQYLMQRHEREIFPLVHRRRLFAGVENFLIYDLFEASGIVNEDVFAYSNGAYNPSTGKIERALVLYNNRFSEARGWIRSSSAYLDKSGGARALVQKSLGQGLGLHPLEDHFSIFKDQVSGLEYIRSSSELCEKGMYVELGAYKYNVLLDWHEVRDDSSRQYSQLNAYLAGRGVPSIQEALREILLQPLRLPFKELVNVTILRRLERLLSGETLGDETGNRLVEEVEGKYARFLRAAKEVAGAEGNEQVLAHQVMEELQALVGLTAAEQVSRDPKAVEARVALRDVRTRLEEDEGLRLGLAGWLFVHAIGKIADDASFADLSRTWIDEWLLGRSISETLQELGQSDHDAYKTVNLIKLTTSHQSWHMNVNGQPPLAEEVLSSWLKDEQVQAFLQVNRHQDVLWFNKESFDELLDWMLATGVIGQKPEIVGKITAMVDVVEQLRRASLESDYQLDKLIEASKGKASVKPTGAMLDRSASSADQ